MDRESRRHDTHDDDPLRVQRGARRGPQDRYDGRNGDELPEARRDAVRTGLARDQRLPLPPSPARTLAEPSGWQMSVMQIDSSVRPSGGTLRPRSIMSLRSNAEVSGCGIADCTPTRTRPSA